MTGTVIPLDPYQHAGLISAIEAVGRARGYDETFVALQRERLIELFRQLHAVARFRTVIGDAIAACEDLAPATRERLQEQFAGEAAAQRGVTSAFIAALDRAFPPRQPPGATL